MLAKENQFSLCNITLASEVSLRHKLYLLLPPKTLPVVASIPYPPYLLLLPHLCLPATSGHALLRAPLEIAIFFHKLTFLTTGLVLGMGNYFKPSQIESFSWFLKLEKR